MNLNVADTNSINLSSSEYSNVLGRNVQQIHRNVTLLKPASLWITAGLLFVSAVVQAQAPTQDVPGSKDHDLVSRFPGSGITRYDSRKYDEFRFINRKMGIGESIIAGNSTKKEGRFTEIVYKTSGERTTLEVFRNYRSALVGGGMTLDFECEGKPKCGSETQYINGAGKPMTGNLLRNGDMRYIYGKLPTPNGTVYASVFTMRGATDGLGTIWTRLNLIETDEMETGLINVDAVSMEKIIAATGRVSLYGIYFDTGSSVVKPESGPTLEEIAKLLKNNPRMDLLVIGHTDNVGGFEFNIGLSEKRANAVVQILVSQYGVPEKRLRGYGIGYVSPVTTNRNEGGRSKNRRVELVEQ